MDDYADKGYIKVVNADDWAKGTWPTRILQGIGFMMFLLFWLNLDTIVPILLGH